MLVPCFARVRYFVALHPTEVMPMEWFLINVVSPLLLPIFVIVVLCLIVDVKPDFFIKIYVDIVRTVVVAVFNACLRALKAIVGFLYNLLKCLFQCVLCALDLSSCGEDKKPAPKPPPRRKPGADSSAPEDDEA